MKKQFQIKTQQGAHHFILLCSLTLALSFVAFSQQNPWTAPPVADQKVNSVKSDLVSIAAGKTLYTKECFSCHGKYGKGDGPAAAALGKSAGDLSSAKSQAQSDGAYLWKIQTGKPPMPSFQKKLSETQVWQLVNYIRTFKTTSK